MINTRVSRLIELETVTGARIAPHPVQRPIPLWFGARSAPAYRRAGRLGDGWFPQVQPGRELDEAREIVHRGAVDAGRDPAALGLEAAADAHIKALVGAAEALALPPRG